MPQNYEVHIDGKLLIIGERAEFDVLPSGFLAVRVDAREEIGHLLQTLVDRPELKGMCLFASDKEAVWSWFRAGYRIVQAAGGAVSDGQGRLLAIHRLGRWDLPKGKVERNELLEAAALREVQEECGLQDLRLIRPLCRTWHTYVRNGEQQLKQTDWFLMEGNGGETLTPQAEEDIDEVRWVHGEGLKDVRRDTYPSLQRVISAWEEANPGPA